MTSRSIALVFCCAGAGLLGGCKDNKRPAPPAIGTQIDRMGRAGVNTALTAPFAPAATHDSVQDQYNAASNPTQWAGLFSAPIQGNLAILDSLDQNCGNQLLAAAPGAGRYSRLAGVLVDDRLYVNTASGTCQSYLAVEKNALGVLNSDCGGRTPLYDTIDTTYSVLALGTFSGVTDGISIDADGQASLTAFPFLSDPN